MTSWIVQLMPDWLMDTVISHLSPVALQFISTFAVLPPEQV
jgi:hypothetical protein